MRVIVSDSSALIDLAKAELIEAAFSLPFEFQVPDVLLADELIDLGPYTVNELDLSLEVSTAPVSTRLSLTRPDIPHCRSMTALHWRWPTRGAMCF